ncbi:MAG: hypothetical protein ACR2LJ_06640 [Acidimicrobiales bacterium]
MVNRPAAIGVVVTAAAILASSACGGSGKASSGTGGTGGATSSTVAGPPLGAAVDGLCLARSQADTDPNSVRGTFYDRSHEAVHTIARELEAVDRSLAARLLEAKEAVEVDVNAEPLAPTLATDLDRLIDAARRGLARLSVPARACQ